MDIYEDRQSRFLAKTADFMGIPVQEMRRIVEEEWSANSGMVPGWIPANWREGRRLYELEFAGGWWIDTSHSATLASLNDSIGCHLHDDGVLPQTLTLSEVTSGDRLATTLPASKVREKVLDDGSYPWASASRPNTGPWAKAKATATPSGSGGATSGWRMRPLAWQAHAPSR